MKPEETIEILRQAHRDPISEVHFAAVRARVLSQIAAERPSRRGNWIFGFLAAAAAVTGLMFWPKPPVRQPRPTLALIHRAELPAPLPILEKVRPAQVTRIRRVRRKPLVTAVVGPKLFAVKPQQPLVVKLITDDPSIVIYWISEGTGE